MAERGRPLFSIGAVARMLDLSAGTIRTWESRYGLVTPERSQGGQRLYTRANVGQLRFVKRRIEEGRRPAEAHRLLQERLARGDSFDGTNMRVLLAESGLEAARVLRELIGAEALDALPTDAAATALVVIDPGEIDLDEMSDRLRGAGVRILPVDDV